MSRKRRILILSSLPPEHSAGLGTDLMNALACNGDKVTYFSRWPSALHAPGIKSMHRTLWQRIVALFISHRRYRKKYRTEMSGAPLINGIRVLYPDERDPQESTGRIARQIRLYRNAVLARDVHLTDPAAPELQIQMSGADLCRGHGSCDRRMLLFQPLQTLCNQPMRHVSRP